ncbi:hypothetical protein [Streptomyces sp. NPDC013455]|uniref:hypothetical protein n=1 Tax=Streptomyces sp. NPDC013455 TaxID=3155605 RepID=UPI0033D8BDC5
MPAAPTVDAPEWDAVRVPRQLGLAAMSILGARAGAVIEDPAQTAVYFFLPVGAAATWDVKNTCPLYGGETVPLPPARRMDGPGPHWRICPGDDGWLTNPDALAAAIADAFGPRVGEGPAE